MPLEPLPAMGPSPPPQDRPTCVIADPDPVRVRSVNLYPAPDLKSDPESIPCGVQASVLGEDATWLLVSLRGVEGFVERRCVLLEGDHNALAGLVEAAREDQQWGQMWVEYCRQWAPSWAGSEPWSMPPDFLKEAWAWLPPVSGAPPETRAELLAAPDSSESRDRTVYMQNVDPHVSIFEVVRHLQHWGGPLIRGRVRQTGTTLEALVEFSTTQGAERFLDNVDTPRAGMLGGLPPKAKMARVGVADAPGGHFLPLGTEPVWCGGRYQRPEDKN